MNQSLRRRLRQSVLSFRGYNVTNHGRTLALLDSAEHGPVVRRWLEQGSTIATNQLGRPVDLVAITRSQRLSTLENYPEDLALIIVVELAHLELLERALDCNVRDFGCLMGYSLGEIAAVVAAGVYPLAGALGPLLQLSTEAARLAESATMGVLFSREHQLNCHLIDRLCQEISALGAGTLAISTYLSPNTLLLLGQHDTLDRFKERMPKELPRGLQLRKNPSRWPPLHTPIVRQVNLSDRSAVAMATTPGGFTAPSVPILSCVTGEFSYTDINSRSLLTRWITEPQQLWKALHTLLDGDYEVLYHVGPEANIVPATLGRLQQNVLAQMNRKSLSGMGLRAASYLGFRQRWLRHLMTEHPGVLRAPFVEQIPVEDWLLGTAPATGVPTAPPPASEPTA